MKIKLDLSVTEINRLSRYIDKNADGTIDYYKFLDALKKINKNIKQEENFKDLEDFTNRLSNYMKYLFLFYFFNAFIVKIRFPRLY